MQGTLPLKLRALRADGSALEGLLVRQRRAKITAIWTGLAVAFLLALAVPAHADLLPLPPVTLPPVTLPTVTLPSVHVPPETVPLPGPLPQVTTPAVDTPGVSV